MIKNYKIIEYNSQINNKFSFLRNNGINVSIALKYPRICFPAIFRKIIVATSIANDEPIKIRSIN